LSLWVADATGNGTSIGKEENNRLLLGVYTALGISQSLVFLGGALTVYFGSLLASKKLHNEMLATVIHAPMSFFDTTPLGRIINRFGEDTDAMDNDLRWYFFEWIGAFFQVITFT